jgi:hypothetical protein
VLKNEKNFVVFVKNRDMTIETNTHMNIEFDPADCPPYRLTFISMSSKCDICRQRTFTRFLPTGWNSHLHGWLRCDECNNSEGKGLRIWNYWVKNNEDLLEEFGEKITVQRSSGAVEDDWEIDGSGHWNPLDEDFVVDVMKEGMSKSVHLQMLREWQTLE